MQVAETLPDRQAADAVRARLDWNYALGLPSVSVEKEMGSDLHYYVHEPGGRLLYRVNASDNNRRARFYRLTRAGRRKLGIETRHWHKVADAMTRVLAAEATS